MPRPKRVCPAGVAQHVIQRGNNRQACFAGDRDLAAYAHWLREAAERFGVAIHAWVFMTNHVHLLLSPSDDNAVSRMMQDLGRCYVRYFNARHGRTGTLWEGRFRSCLVQDRDYLLRCHRYIELNPVRAGMVADPAAYDWSSYRANAMGVESALRTPHPEYLALGESELRLAAYRDLFLADEDEDLLARIRQATRRGMALGDDRFAAEMEALTGRRLRAAPMGRPPKAVECVERR